MKKITVAVCIDDKGGMMFNKRRQSRDRVLIADLCEFATEKIYINEFSQLLFEDHADKIVVVDDPLSDCPDGGICFVENIPLLPFEDDISELLVYKWNCAYPRDMKLDLSLADFRVLRRKEFEGSSHDKITRLLMKRR